MNDVRYKPPALNIVVVTGGNGFIGSHVAKHYFDLGYHVRVIDIVSFSKHDDIPFYTERSIGDLCDLHFCENAFRGAQIVFHFGAVMGGMGVIHPDNDSIIYRANHTITQNVLNAASLSGVQSFFYASSACVYPTSLQADQGSCDVSLRESDVYSLSGPQPQHLYGLEKLNSEQIVLQFADRMTVRIGRFHNVYGPRGSWNDGHEKVPAAFIRKALAAKRLVDLGERPKFEIWGDGAQRRSFLYIDDAVRAVALMMDAEGHVPPLNIGSDLALSVNELAEISLSLVGLEPSDVEFVREERPVGVASRNSNNDLVSTVISWEPRITHRDGLGRTLRWIETQVDLGAPSDPDHIIQYLHSLTSSRMVDLENDHLIKFALLLPITSRPDPEVCIRNLDVFARSLETTSWRDRNQICSTRFEPYIYLAIDDDDDYLLPSPGNSDGPAESILRAHGFSKIFTTVSRRQKGHVCALWRDTARLAYEHTCDYYVLMGDDIELLDEGWMRTIHQRFQTLSDESGGPPGFGCVAFTDITFPGMPTFPVVHRTHMDIFNGHVVPEEFINQDGDPYLFQMYRHFGASTTVPVRLHNSVGGSDDARYEKQHLSNWTFEPLENGKTRIREWAALHAPRVEQKMSLDVIVPSYRVELERLQRILDLKPSPTCITMFIVIIDDPTSPYIHQLEHTNSHRLDVRIRINKTNCGASASRNRGLTESSAEWVAFLDDDVDPSPNYLVAAEKYIRQHPDAAGFVGNAYFPVAHNIFTAAVHLAGVTYFWDIANKIAKDVPWGVTANLIVRRNIRDDVTFDLIFPKTGGGEDIDYCRKKRSASLARGGTAFWAAPEASVVHPWWNGGERSYWRFYMWSKGDGALINIYPKLSWRDSTPNSAELFALSALVVLPGTAARNRNIIQFGLVLAFTTLIVNILHDAHRHLIRHKDRTTSIKTTIGPVSWVVAVCEGALIRMFSEMGRLVGVLERREWASIGKRFDWFTGGRGDSIIEERNNGIARMVIIVGVCAVFLQYM
ncbi:GDP-mannose 4,6 dehydratase, partial [Rhizoctonia solani]